MNKFYTIVIDREVIKKYNKHYFKKNPRCRKSYFMNNWKTKKKKPKELYSALSLNELLPINHQQYSTLKKQWGDLGEWLCKKNKLNNKQFTNGVIEYRTYNETRTTKDVDNVVAKILNDGLLVKSGMFMDDSYKFLNPYISSMEYDKEHPRLEIRISVIDDKIKDTYEKLKIHMENFKD